MTLIQWDNATIHMSALVKKFARTHKNDLFLINQTPYSPELNPQENMWKWLKSFISKATAAINEQEILNMVRNFHLYMK